MCRGARVSFHEHVQGRNKEVKKLTHFCQCRSTKLIGAREGVSHEWRIFSSSR